MKKVSIIAAIGFAGLLSACSVQSNLADVDTLQHTQATGDAFTRALTDEYRAAALFEADRSSYEAGIFARKGRHASGGEKVSPELVVNMNGVANEVARPLVEGRARMAELFASGATIRQPEVAARAQVAFECWLVSEADHDYDSVPACHATFLSALSELREAPSVNENEALAHIFLVYFAFNKATVGEEANLVIDHAAVNARALHVTRIGLVGHSDRVGGPHYNQQLSLRRAEAVKAELVARGIPANEIAVIGRGSSDPAVAGRGREPRNRRVEIILP